MKIVLLFIGKTTDNYLKEGIEEYLKRLKNYISVSTVVIPVSASKDVSKAMNEEGKVVQSKLLPGDFLVILDEKGTQISSRELATQFQKWMLQSIGRVVIVVGGPFGVSPELKTKANYTLSVSRMTFTHQMVRLILVEQIYRAMSILKNERYHHD